MRGLRKKKYQKRYRISASCFYKLHFTLSKVVVSQIISIKTIVELS